MNWEFKHILAPCIWLLAGILIGVSIDNYSQQSGQLGSLNLEKFERRIDALAAELELTVSQHEEVEAILQETREKLVDIRKERRPQLQTLRKDTLKRLRNVLTPEQRKRFVEIRKETKSQNL